jgi:hypothetical protein
MTNELVSMWEEVAERKEREWKELWGNNQTTGPLVYWRDVVPYKSLVRAARLQADEAICWGAMDCLNRPLTKCVAQKHETCNEHAGVCFLCKI